MPSKMHSQLKSKYTNKTQSNLFLISIKVFPTTRCDSLNVQTIYILNFKAKVLNETSANGKLNALEALKVEKATTVSSQLIAKFLSLADSM